MGFNSAFKGLSPYLVEDRGEFFPLCDTNSSSQTNCKKHSTENARIPISTQSDFSDQLLFYISIANMCIFLFNIFRTRKTRLSFLVILLARGKYFHRRI